jgi:hypothetical protein
MISGSPDVNRLEEWLDTVCSALELDGDLDRDLVLDLARDVAHGVARPAAPLTTFLVGLAAGRAGGSREDVTDAAARVAALVRGPSGADE